MCNAFTSALGFLEALFSGDAVNKLIREVVAQDLKIVAKEKLIHAPRVLPAENGGGNS